jgi:DNA-binding MarR family transcriptional regulator
VHRADDETDRRRKLIRLTPRGVAALAMSAMIFHDIRSRWEGALGADQLAAFEADLRAMSGADTFRLDVPGWFGA